MENLISTAILIATLLGGTIIAGRIHHAVREAALAKAAQGLPRLSALAVSLTKTGLHNCEQNRKSQPIEATSDPHSLSVESKNGWYGR